MEKTLKKKFLSLLKRRKTPIKADVLIKRLGLQGNIFTCRRKISKLREAALKDGVLVVANKDGYYIARSEEDINKYINMNKHRAFSVFKNLRRIMKSENALESIQTQDAEKIEFLYQEVKDWT